MKVYEDIFDRLISPENLFGAWEEFCRGKRSRPDVRAFEWQLEENLFALYRALRTGAYRHGSYSAFIIQDPKQRRIHKASVRDRILHHAVFGVLNPLLESGFITHSFSCRKGKGTHRGVDALEQMLRQVSRNHTRSCFALKCDVHQFFASVDHGILLEILGRRIKDPSALSLLAEIIGSFSSTSTGKGIPIGNLTSQLFANVYLNAFDQFIKHKLRIRHYVRYTDDFVIASEDEAVLVSLIPPIRSFLRQTLRLDLHPRKVSIRKYRQGIDFLGYVLLPHHRVLRTRTKRRMVKKLRERERERACRDGSCHQAFQSYVGVLSHADAYRLTQDLRNQYGYLALHTP